MPSPSTSLATLRPDLGDSLQEFDLMMNMEGFIGNQVLPVIETGVAAAEFGRIPIEELLKNAETRRGSDGRYSRGTWTFTDDSFSTKEHGHEVPVDERDNNVYQNYFDAELISAGIAQHTVMANYEKRCADLLFNTTTFTPTAVVNEWDDYANATPIEDIEASVQRVYAASGLWPNSLIINRLVFRNLRQCAQIRDRVSSSGAGSSELTSRITRQLLAEAFDLDNVFVAGGTQNTANEGQAAAISQYWSGEYAMVAKVARTNNIKEPCVGRTFHWSGDGSTMGAAMETYRDETTRADIVRARMETHEKTLHVEAADLLENITT